ncbi:bifunctional methionine sulfoxide reductase B/A protein [Parabacteroides sp. FAFU027]|uniref:bifunctional methionine sulfoxide reductase B/A protein n=1 Tax=Parabacteroides sp. FAFU027 TaxID=2922715 RepID=UPI001FAFC7C5|nr:bifunctional methionine sulfoxide reductase B/A protein [Parabacteroides sp. FAFU027]
MKTSWIYLLILFFLPNCIQSQKKNNIMDKFNKLTPEEEYVIIKKGTERPFTGKYVNFKGKGLYLCRQCNAPLYRSSDKFESECGWPSFDDEIPGAVKRIPDADGQRTEIVCAHCGGHLGHVFLGEGFTPKNTRHCVNSVSLDFAPADTAYFASGCFWGTEYYFERAKGVITTDVGYMGGHLKHPTYKEVCTGTTGHVETTQVVFDTRKTTYEEMVKLFFETHDFTQVDGQGPDIGPQYHSVLFYENEQQHALAEKYMQILRQKGYHVATKLAPASQFWRAEEYHQNYYTHKNGTPYCHIYRKIF